MGHQARFIEHSLCIPIKAFNLKASFVSNFVSDINDLIWDSFISPMLCCRHPKPRSVHIVKSLTYGEIYVISAEISVNDFFLTSLLSGMT